VTEWLAAALYAGSLMKNAVFWDVTPCDSYKNQRFGGTYRLHHHGEENQLARHIQEDYIFHSHRRENLKSYIAFTGWAL
jgi:hypothetical protein